MNYIVKYCISIIFINFFLCHFFYGQKKIELEKIRKEKILEIEKIENIISETKQDKNLSISKIDLISKKIIVRNEIIENLTSSLEDINRKINVLNEDINSKNVEIINLKEQYSKIIYSSYFRLKDYNIIMFILSSRNFNQAYRRLYFLKQYSNERKNLITKIFSEISEYKIIITKTEE